MMETLKKLFVLILLSLLDLSLAYAQEFSIKDFFLAQTDLTANTPGTMVRDQNGNVCALIKVETSLDDITYDVGILGICQTKRVGGEFWLYVPFGIRKINIGHKDLGVIRDFYFPIPIDSGCTYILKLNTPVASRTYDDSRTQMLVLNVNPQDAKVMINYSPVKLNNGVYSEQYYLGKYDLDVTADRYHDLKTAIQITDPDNPCQVNISLKPKFGWLTIKSEGDEKLYLDDQLHSFKPGVQFDLNSSTYRLRIEKPLHKPYETVISITDSLSLMLEPEFEAVYRDITFNVGNNARIWIDGRQVGTGRYRQKLEYGVYTIECRLDSHTSTKKVLTVTPDTPELISLDTPVPILGTLKVNCAPNSADVYINGSRVGTTPYFAETLVGDYEMTLKKEGYNPKTVSVNVQENEVTYVNEELDKNMPVKISSTPSATLYVDGKRVGETPMQIAVESGTHQVTMIRNGYVMKRTKIDVTRPNQAFSYNLKKDPYDGPVSLEFGGGVTVGTNDFRADLFAAYHPIKNLDKWYLAFEYSPGMKSSDWIETTVEENGSYVTKKVRRTVMTLSTGYNIFLGASCKITPTLGVASLSFPEVEDSSYMLRGGVKLSAAIMKGVELYVTPQYNHSLSRSEYHSNLCQQSPEFNSFDTGFNISFGLAFYLTR